MADLHFPRATRAHAERRHTLAPEADDAFRAFSKAVLADGGSMRCTKQIIAMAVGHVKAARRAVVSAEQIMEAI